MEKGLPVNGEPFLLHMYGRSRLTPSALLWTTLSAPAAERGEALKKNASLL
jgi:hypothetical protein